MQMDRFGWMQKESVTLGRIGQLAGFVTGRPVVVLIKALLLPWRRSGHLPQLVGCWLRDTSVDDASTHVN